MNRNIIYLFGLIAMLTLGLSSCSNSDDLSDTSIFPTTPVQRDDFDKWLIKNYTNPYNVEFKYKMEDIETNMKYNLVPPDSAKAAKLAIIVKHLWFDAYSECLGQDFVKENVPRSIVLVGSPAYNSEGTIVLGTAEGGMKVTLYMVNSLTDEVLHDYATLNTYYFHTIHHEFTHILNQKKPYDRAFDKVTESGYVSGNWYQIDDATAHQAGFVTPYAMVEPLEDFAEMMSTYVTDSSDDWNAILKDAGTDGAAKINEKLEYVRNYMKNSWGLDIDRMRSIVMRRAGELKTLDLEHLN